MRIRALQLHDHPRDKWLGILRGNTDFMRQFCSENFGRNRKSFNAVFSDPRWYPIAKFMVYRCDYPMEIYLLSRCHDYSKINVMRMLLLLKLLELHVIRRKLVDKNEQSSRYGNKFIKSMKKNFWTWWVVGFYWNGAIISVVKSCKIFFNNLALKRCTWS